MRTLFLKGLLVLGTVATGAVCAYAAVDAEKTSPTQAVTQQAVDRPSTVSTQASTPTAQAETLKITAVTQPFQVAAVSGDYHKYEAMTWQNRGYSGGIKDLDINYTSGDDITIDAGGRGIIGNGDYKGYYSIKKKDAGYVDVDFKQFRKYYDTYGGIYRGLSRSLSRDLSLDIGHFGIEAGITMPDLPNISVYYEHEYKDGSKSMLQWANITGDIPTRKIGPSWQEIKESVDTFGIKGDYTEKGYHFTGDHQWEIAKSKTLVYQQPITVTGGRDAPGTQVRQYFTTDTTVMTTKVGVDKWCLNDKIFGSSAYRFIHLKNDQVNKIVSLANGGPNVTAITTPNADGQNDQDVNSWVMNFMVSPWNWLAGTGGFKAEVNTRDGASYFPNAAGTSIFKYNTESNTYKFAETAGLRFKAIPRTVIYSDLSFEQSQNHLIENQIQLIGAPAPISRDAIIDEPVITWATGADFQPVRFINLTSQVRLRDKEMDFNERFRVNPFSQLAFLDWLHTRSLGFTQRATAKLSSWGQASFRYLYDDTKYMTRQLEETRDQKANMLSNTFIYDLSVFPLSNLSMTGSFSERHDATETIGASNKTFLLPTATSDFYTWTFSTDYQPHDKVSLDGTLFYTVADNYNNFATYNPADQVYYGSDYNQLGLTVSCKWDIRKDLSVTPQYGFQRYMPNENSGIGAAYDAQIFSVAIAAKWG